VTRINWTAVALADHYEVEIEQQSAQSGWKPYLKVQSTNPWYESAFPEGFYRTRITVYNALGFASAPSAWDFFSIIKPPPPPPPEKEAPAEEKGSLDADREALNKDREALNEEKEALNKDRETLNEEKEALNKKKEALVTEGVPSAPHPFSLSAGFEAGFYGREIAFMPGLAVRAEWEANRFIAMGGKLLFAYDLKALMAPQGALSFRVYGPPVSRFRFFGEFNFGAVWLMYRDGRQSFYPGALTFHNGSSYVSILAEAAAGARITVIGRFSAEPYALFSYPNGFTFGANAVWSF
jgi:hypothetical protein